MGEYIVSVYAKWQIGLSLGFEYGQIVIRVLCFTVHISTSKDAKGVFILTKEF